MTGGPVGRIAERIRKHIQERSSHVDALLTPTKFSEELDQLLEALAAAPTRNNKVSAAREELTRRRSTIDKLKRDYKHGHIRAKVMHDEWAAQDRADSIDRVKVLIYRVATTLCIAGVVLLTSYLAQQWHIPLPMLRLQP